MRKADVKPKCLICGGKDNLYVIETKKNIYYFHPNHFKYKIRHLLEEDFKGRYLTVTTSSGKVYYMNKPNGLVFIEKFRKFLFNFRKEFLDNQG